MGIIETILLWWNLPFVLPLCLALLLAMLQAVGALHFGNLHIGHGGTGAHSAGGHLHLGDHHLHLGDHHLHLGHHHDVGHAAADHHLPGHAHTVTPHGHGPGSHEQQGHAAHVQHSHEIRPMARMLGLLGIGRVPITSVISSFFLLWGTAGLVSNKLLGAAIPQTGIFPVGIFATSAAIAFSAASVGTGVLSRLLGKLMPKDETYGATPYDLVGKLAVSNMRITAKTGTALTTDDYHCRIEVYCRTETGQPEIPRDTQVLLWEYDPDERSYIVRPDPTGLMLDQPQPQRQIS